MHLPENIATFFERITDAFIALDKEWRYTYLNKKAGDFFNRKPAEMVGRNIWEEFPNDINSPFYKAYHKAMDEQQYVYVEEFYAPSNRWFENHIYPSADGLSIFFADITEKKLAAEKILKANRLYDFLSQVNQMIVRITDETLLFEEICNIAITRGQFRMAWIGLLDPTTNLITPVMYSGEEKGYLSKIKSISVDDAIAEGRGPTGTALREGKYIVCNDIENDPQMSPWKDIALSHGYHSSIALPIKKFEKVIGAFTLYARVKNFFDASEIALLEEATGDISFAMEVFEKESLRKKAEEALLKSERRYQMLAEVSPVGIFHTDADGNTTYVNPRWYQISGLTIGTALGKGWLNAVYVEDRKKLMEGWQEATRSEKISVSEYRFVRPDGSIIWVMGQATPERDENNKIVGYVGTTTDITERKKAEEEITQEKYFTDSIINSLPGVFYLYDEKGKFLRWNMDFETVTGYSAAEIATMHPLDFFDTDEKKKLSIKIQRVFEKGMAEVEANFFCKNKNKIPYYFNGRAINLGGKPCLLGMGIDITELKKVEEQITNIEEQRKLIMSAALDAIICIDTSGVVTFWNPQAEKIFGWKESEVKNKLLSSLIIPEPYRKMHEMGIANYLQTGEGPALNVLLELRAINRQGNEFPIELTVLPIKQGEDEFFCAFIRDITGRKKVEHAIKESEEKFRTLIEQAGEGIFLVDLQGNYLEANESASRITGYTIEELKQMNANEIVPTEELTKVPIRLAEIKKGNPVYIERLIRKKDGSIITAEISAKLMANGKVMTIMRDITSRKKAEAEIKEANDQLRQLTVHLQDIREEERKRIGREIHDELGQQLTAIKMDVAWIDKKVPEELNNIKSKLKNIITLLDGSHLSIRKILNELRSDIIENNGIIDALEWQGNQFSINTGIPLVFSSTEKMLIVEEAVSTCLFRIFQEALTNITRYSQAKKVTATVKYLNNWVTMEVTDDGIGFDASLLNTKQSFGILGMKERVTSLQGTFELITGVGKGTKIIVAIPT